MNTRLVATCRTALAVGALIYAMAATAAMAAVSPPRPASEQPPNVVLLLADDLDLAVLKSGLDAGLYPHIAALLTTSTSFSNAFVSLSSCGPSRATYLTGQFPHNHGTIRNSGPNGGFQSFNDQATTGVWLQAAGYRTGLIGKYINGYGGSQANYTPPGWNVWHALIDLAQYNYRITVPGGVQTYGAAPADYQTDVVAGYADQFIRSSGSGPFFLKVTPTAPHLEGENDFGQPGSNGIRPPPRYVGTATVPLPMKNLASYNEANLSDKPAWMRHSHKADTPTMKRVFNEKRTAMRAIDDMVGRLVATLQETGHWDNTLFALASDNGFQYGTHRRIVRKLDFYEESIRVPLIVKEP
jgi:arylsulfatase A-like enzyme